jgi:ribosomal protein L11 methyltransferase
VPEWVDEPADQNGGDTNIRIRVDPGRAFGTGTHESTKLCLQSLGALAPSLPKPPRTLDLGCGTGILGIAAVKRLGATVVACDYDPLATSSARKHADMNDVRLEVVLTDGCRSLLPGRFDLVFANLMAPFLISRVAEITAVGAPGCRFVLAGLLGVEEAEVRAAWPPHWKVTSSYQGDWASLRYERP